MPKNAAAVTLGRLGGKVKSEAKTLAARENARKPRPRAKMKEVEQSIKVPDSSSQGGDSASVDSELVL